MRPVIIAAMLLGLSALPVRAGSPMTIEVVCPIDGEKFNFVTSAMYSTFGLYADGMPVGTWTFPPPLPQCPKSRLPILEEPYSDEEIVRLRAMVETPEYKAVQNESSYYLMNFVLGYLRKHGPESQVPYLLQATWQVYDQPVTYARYADELTAAFDAAAEGLRAEDDGYRFFCEMSLINVLRQAGRFDEATRRLETLVPYEGENSLPEWTTLTRDLIAAKDRSRVAIRRLRDDARAKGTSH